MDLRIVIGHAVKVALLVTIAGLAYRGRGKRCLAMWAYLWFALLGNSLTTFWPSLFFHYEFWARRQIGFDLLKLAIAVEVAARALGPFPGAQASWRRSTFIGLAGALTIFLVLPRVGPEWTLFPYQPQVVTITVWVFTVTALVAMYYRIPIDPWHRALMLGFAPYQLVFVYCLALWRTLGMPAVPWANAIDSLAYLALACWWAVAAWRPEEELVVSPEVRRRLRLETA